jgi:hypothetical protein
MIQINKVGYFWTVMRFPLRQLEVMFSVSRKLSPKFKAVSYGERKPRGCLTAMRFHRRQLYPKGHKEIAFPRRKGKSKKTAGCL